ncbi:carboxymuconolactone decarboxylase family protein (plasmid) [Photobacterium sp. GJ3]|uniref:carboxymuconolactone decarboxylase family protein n=1 Tax=Photobacterium sp. GJ3 TaxID=2829502 RepID=UPI001B8C3958|nr:carboxymuconolactone decarboxylase family protein [Photobacterium sp. GJ3]QUJ70161.1 carboxymuconolactone decarboxylase family protein [Photobacterium sp. GJ3]
MTARLDYFSTAPQAMEILVKQEHYFHHQFRESATMSMTIWELVKLRVSQINQCAFCIDMHSKDAIKLGEQPERLYGLNAWRDMPMYTDQERVALAFAETLTAAQPISETQYQEILNTFGEQSMVDLTLAINAMNSWNRVVKTFQPAVGSF